MGYKVLYNPALKCDDFVWRHIIKYVAPSFFN